MKIFASFGAARNPVLVIRLFPFYAVMSDMANFFVGS
jgi:hypothetical protein